mgnify:CR=1 FL=1
MEIKFIGHSCFEIKGKDTKLVIDPYDPEMIGYKLPGLNADVVLVSHDHADHSYVEGVKDYKLLIETPGDYEIEGTFIYGLKTYHDDKEGKERGKNTIFQIIIDDFNILHLGDLGHELKTETLEKISDVDVLMIPIGGTYTINAKKAVNVISSLEPGIVIPMHYKTDDLGDLKDKLDDLDNFLTEFGVEENGVKRLDKLTLRTKSDIPDESEIYVLNPQH